MPTFPRERHRPSRSEPWPLRVGLERFAFVLQEIEQPAHRRARFTNAD
ncbi:hypothetical protein GCU60_03260 [Blastococcus saxobsidens]|uniref:Uncharacterized protein n=1 Tax=Blastococcus saxobsidens TaxID=138336 RepID=A0A6L9VYD2_9ACTN|nr:hypothetical protein [Blastococcus saxobsidens]NEK84785.1 hypothetical protein [Blastococcus saxobsidens]